MAAEQSRTAPIVSGVTTSTSPAPLIAPRAGRTKLIVQNIDGTIAVFIAPISSGIVLTAVGAPGSLKLIAGAMLTFDNIVFNDGLNVISASGTPIVSVWDF